MPDLASARAALIADCSRCLALCCVGPAFAASADFPIDKPAGTPCPNLGDRHACRIHHDLRGRGFRGCVAYDCFGAGQHLTTVTFADPDDTDAPDAPAAQADPDDTADPDAAAGRRPTAGMLAALPVMRLLHELLWYLTEAVSLDAVSAPTRAAAAAALDSTRAMTALPADELLALDPEEHRRAVATVLRRTSLEARRVGGPLGRELAGADLAGAALPGGDLRRADLRGATLLGADLRAADLRHADLLGADTRGADLAGADLRGALFVTRQQLDGALWDAGTRLPAQLSRPAHW